MTVFVDSVRSDDRLAWDDARRRAQIIDPFIRIVLLWIFFAPILQLWTLAAYTARQRRLSSKIGVGLAMVAVWVLTTAMWVIGWSFAFHVALLFFAP